MFSDFATVLCASGRLRQKNTLSLSGFPTRPKSLFFHLHTQRSQTSAGQLPVPRDSVAASSCEEKTRTFTGNKEGKNKKIKMLKLMSQDPGKRIVLDDSELLVE